MSEISGAISVGAGGNVSAALDQLVEAGLVSRDIGMNPETGDEIRERRYRLSDNYVRFYLKCIQPAAKTIDAGTFRYSRLARFEEWNAVKGFAFENLIVNQSMRENWQKPSRRMDILTRSSLSDACLECDRQTEHDKQQGESCENIDRPVSRLGM